MTPSSKATDISATEPDWSRENKAWWVWMPSRSLLASLRAYTYWRASSQPWAGLMRRLATVRHRFWSAVTGADIPLGSQIGGGLLLPHPQGVVIHPEVDIGPNCLIFQQVTIGASSHGIPRIGGHVDIGAGAKIIGPIQVGDHARIGVNAVVIHDIPPGATVVAPVAQTLSA